MFAAPEGAPVITELLHSSLPVWIVLLPMFAGIMLYLIGERHEILRKAAALAVSLLALAGVVGLLPAALAGAAEYRLVDFMQLGLFFRVDMISWIFALLITLVWFLATIFSLAYMDLEHNRRRYYSFLIFTLGATLGVVCAGDFFTLFLFFELMTFSSFVLVIHEQDRQAMQAGSLYLYLGVAGGLALLFAVMLVFAATGTVEIMSLPGQLESMRTLVFILFFIGFGIKAGLVPLHIWLPQAHPVAPSPASALLSGIMIKAGAYGILRVTMYLYGPGEAGAAVDWAFLSLLGIVILWIGIVTMFAGALMALLQTNAKRILAYSSVSQIGYIAMGLGAAAYLGVEGGMGFAGAVYHIINHAFFKAGLFMIVGTVYMYTHELELPRLGGMARKMPLAAAAFIVAALGIAGIPGFNGYPSKTLLHDTLLIALKDYGYLNIQLAEYIFTVTSALTICYFAKLFRGLFLGPVPEKLDREYSLPLSVKVTLSSFSLLIIGIGLFPNFVLEEMIVPAAQRLGFAGYAMNHLFHFTFFQWDLLKAMVIVVALAAVIYLPGAYRGWFNWVPPHWLSVQFLLYRHLTRGLTFLVCRGGNLLESGVGFVYDRSSITARYCCRYIGDLDASLDHLYERSGQAARSLADRSTQVDRALDDAYARTGEAARRLVDRTTDFDHALDDVYDKTGKAAKKLVDRAGDLDHAIDHTYEVTGHLAKGLTQEGKRLDEALDQAYEKAGQSARRLAVKGREWEQKEAPVKEDRTTRWKPSQWNIKNLNFDSLLLAAVLGVVLFIIFYYSR